MTSAKAQTQSPEPTFKTPTADDGPALHRLIADCPPLDVNSRYCNLLQVSHFADTCVLAELDGELVGSVTGYRLPGDPSTVFVWQVAVHPKGRGMGLGRRMLHALVDRPACEGVRYMDTTITEDNVASWKMFEGFAADRDAPTDRRVFFDSQKHFDGAHASEMLLRIGPF